MLADCLGADRRFGITRARPPGPGALGTIAAIQVVHPLPDGRSNIVVSGEERFRLQALAGDDSTPYLVAEVEPVADQPASAPSDSQLARLRGAIGRIREALAVLRDESLEESNLPASPEALSFLAAALAEADLDTQERLLSLRSTGERVELLLEPLSSQARVARERAAIHLRARSNGHGHDHQFGDGPDS